MFSCEQNYKQKAVVTMQETSSYKRWSVGGGAPHQAGGELADCSDDAHGLGGV
jgi:hypothetical protein